MQTFKIKVTELVHLLRPNDWNWFAMNSFSLDFREIDFLQI